MLLKGRAEVVVNMEGKSSVWENLEFRSPSISIPVPATLRLIKRVKSKQRRPRFRKKVLFNRDNWTCQYCETGVSQGSAEVEHIIPSSRGGRSSWSNCVTSCHSCNKRKADKTPEEAGMKLLKKPGSPSTLHFWDITKCKAHHPDWEMFISSLR